MANDITRTYSLPPPRAQKGMTTLLHLAVSSCCSF
jgi:hypothetical protein